MLDTLLECLHDARIYKNGDRASWFDGNGIAEEIKKLVEERYVLLPKDADGMSIRVGDKLRSDEVPGREFICLGFNMTQLNGVPWWTVEWRYDGESGTSEYVSANARAAGQ